MVGPVLHLWRWYSLFPPSVAKSSSSTLPRSYFLSMPFRSAAECLPLKFKWWEPTKRGLSFVVQLCVLPGCHAHPFKAPAVVVSSSLVLTGCALQVSLQGPWALSRPLCTVPVSFSLARHGGGLPQPLSHFHGQPWNWKINKHTLPLQCLLSLFLENGGCLGSWELTSVYFCWLHVTLRVNRGDSCAQRLRPPLTFQMLCSTWKSRAFDFIDHT